MLHLIGFKSTPRPFIVFEGNPERVLAEKGENYDGSKDTVFLSDSSTFWKFKPSRNIKINPNYKTISNFYNTYTINSRGFRGKEFKKIKGKGTFRIIAIGDSITFGLAVAENNTYYRLLEKTLNEKLRPLKIEVISMGIPGYASYQALQLLKKEALSYSPDMVIIYCGGNNEFARGLYTDREYAVKIKSSFLDRLSDKILTLKLLKGFSQKFKDYILNKKENNYKNQNDIKFRVPPLNFVEDLMEMKNALDASNAEVIFVVPPHSAESLNEQPDAEEYTSIVRFLGKYVPIADTDLKFKQQNSASLFTNDKVHPNETGHKIIADSLSEVAVEKIKEFFNTPPEVFKKNHFPQIPPKNLYYNFLKSKTDALLSERLLAIDASRIAKDNYAVDLHNIKIIKTNTGKAIWFNGVDAYIKTPLSLNGLNGFSIMFYINPDKTQTTDIVTVLDNGHDEKQDFTLQSAGLSKNIYTFHCFGKDLMLKLSPDTLSHIAFTIDIKNKYFLAYLNGEKKSCSNLPVSATFGANQLVIGKLAKNNSRYFKGAINEVAVWGKVLNDAEIKAVYNILDLKNN